MPLSASLIFASESTAVSEEVVVEILPVIPVSGHLAAAAVAAVAAVIAAALGVVLLGAGVLGLGVKGQLHLDILPAAVDGEGHGVTGAVALHGG